MTPAKASPSAIAAVTEFQAPDASRQHANVWCALAAAQSEFSAPVKGSTNPAFKSRYADLRAVVAAVAPGLSRNGISFAHIPAAVDLGEGPQMCMVTILTHGASDTRIECPIPLIVNKRDMQGLKSAGTYAKRIGLESVTGVAPDDDDGNDAAAAAPQAKPQRQEPKREPEPDTSAIGEYERRLASAPDLAALKAAWEAIPTVVHPHVVAAKDARKAALAQRPAPDLAAELGDTIPY